MRLLVLGGTQFVGRHLVEAALAGGHDVTLCNRGLTNAELFPDVPRIVADRTADDLADRLNGAWDAVVDCNGYLPGHVARSADALRHRVGRYVFVSTISAYATPVPANAAEDAPTAPWPDGAAEDELTGETYGPAKVRCEDAVRAAYAEAATVVRPGVIVGPHDVHDHFTTWVRRMSGTGTVDCAGDPGQRVQVIDARDLATFVLRLVVDGVGGTFNAVGPADPLTLERLGEACRAGTSGSATLRWAPADDAPALPFVLEPAEPNPHVFEISNAAALDAGLTTRPVEETAADVLAWLDQRDRGTA